MKIGIVDLDTSHPESWIPILKALGHEIVGVYDHGDIHPASYVTAFIETHGAGIPFASLADMAAAVDLAIIHGCNWDAHIDRARPFIAAGKAVLIDKPLGGRLADLAQIQSWIAQGHRITGGSGLLHCAEAAAIRAQADTQHWRTAFVGCGIDEFNYGIHAYSLLVALFGPGVQTVRHLGTAPQHSIEVQWTDGRQGILNLANEGRWLPFHASLVGRDTVTQFQVDATKLYRTHIEAILPYLAGDVVTPPIAPDTLILPEQIALAARQSQLADGAPVSLSAISPATHYDGLALQRHYRSLKYPNPSAH